MSWAWCSPPPSSAASSRWRQAWRWRRRWAAREPVAEAASPPCSSATARPARHPARVGEPADLVAAAALRLRITTSGGPSCDATRPCPTRRCASGCKGHGPPEAAIGRQRRRPCAAPRWPMPPSTCARARPTLELVTYRQRGHYEPDDRACRQVTNWRAGRSATDPHLLRLSACSPGEVTRGEQHPASSAWPTPSPRPHAFAGLALA